MPVLEKVESKAGNFANLVKALFQDRYPPNVLKSSMSLKTFSLLFGLQITNFT